ncbi:N5-glutamine methyltransferase family protein [Cellulomonas sp. P5_C5]
MLFNEVETPETVTTDDLRRYRDSVADLLAEAGVPTPKQDAEALLAYALGEPFVDWDDLPPTGPAVDEERAVDLHEELPDLVERRQNREPLQRIIGTTVFRQVTLTMSEDDDVFVPRRESEAVAQLAIDEATRIVAARREPLVVDLCCGSGAIGVSVDVEVPGSRVVAVDVSPEAVRLTRHNAGTVGTLTQRTLLGDVNDPTMLAELDGTVDVVVANPPYFTPDTLPDDPELRDHEPDLALYGGGSDGLDVTRAVVAAAARLLRPGGVLVVQHAGDHGAPAVVAATECFDVVDVPDCPNALVARRI